jgi:catechol 2,3-dioxygenase-like lactoylglutathione lyase family enzyme
MIHLPDRGEIDMMKEITRIDTVFVPVTNLERSEKWYMTLFNLKVIFRSSDGAYVGFRFKEATSVTALTIHKVEQVPESSHATFNFYTSDVDASYAFMKAQDVEVSDIEEGDGVRFFHCKDPDGNQVEIVWFPE